MASKLSAGAVAAMYKGEPWNKPLVQVIDIKKIQGPNGATQPERFRLVISDGVHFQQAMLATQLNPLIQSQTIANRSIVCLNEYICNTVHGRRIVIILNIEAVQPPLAENLGNPQSIESVIAGTSDASSAPAPAAGSQRTQYSTPHASAAPTRQPQHNAAAFGGFGQEGIVPIKGLNPYQNKWTIKARVTNKSDKRNFVNAKGPGQLFTVDLLDALGGEIRATFFGEAVDQYFNELREGGVYLISKGHVKYANKKFSNLKNDYEITLDKSSVVQPCGEDDNIKAKQYHFVEIADLPSHQKDEVLDVIGIIYELGSMDTINTKTGSAINKRVLQLADQSGARVELTLWGEKAEMELQHNAILAAKGVKVSNFNTCSLTALRTSMLTQEPSPREVPHVEKLRTWWDEQGHAQELNAISTARENFGQRGEGQRRNYDTARKTFSQIKTEGIGMQGKPEYFTVRGTVTVIKHDGDNPPWYDACPREDCGKKVSLLSGQYVCPDCGEVSGPAPRYVLSMTANDHTGSSWLTAFNEVARSILNYDAADLRQLREQKNETAYEDVFQDALFRTYLLRVRAAEHKWGDEARVRCNVVKATPVPLAEESRHLISQIHKYLGAQQ